MRTVKGEEIKDKEYYTLKELAQILDVTLTTARSYVTKGIMPSKKIGGEWKTRKEVIDEHLGRPSSLPPKPANNNQITKPTPELIPDKKSKKDKTTNIAQPEVQKKILEIEIKFTVYG